MKKSRRDLSVPRAVVNYKNRAVTEVTIKRKPFLGVAGARVNGSDLSGDSVETPENVAVEINESGETGTTETLFAANNPSTDTSTSSSDLSEVVEAAETVEISGNGTHAEINAVADTAAFVPTMDNTKKEIVAHAIGLGIEVKGWWGKQKILDAISG